MLLCTSVGSWRDNGGFREITIMLANLCFPHRSMLCSLLQRHRAINSVLKEEIPQIHALQIAKCDVLEEDKA